ncbi:Uncharacterised protein [Bordetella pertussis]|nr:Uncharacterised protein [Bordetella pertussis]
MGQPLRASAAMVPGRAQHRLPARPRQGQPRQHPRRTGHVAIRAAGHRRRRTGAGSLSLDGQRQPAHHLADHGAGQGPVRRRPAVRLGRARRGPRRAGPGAVRLRRLRRPGYGYLHVRQRHLRRRRAGRRRPRRAGPGRLQYLCRPHHHQARHPRRLWQRHVRRHRRAWRHADRHRHRRHGDQPGHGGQQGGRPARQGRLLTDRAGPAGHRHRLAARRIRQGQPGRPAACGRHPPRLRRRRREKRPGHQGRRGVRRLRHADAQSGPAAQRPAGLPAPGRLPDHAARRARPCRGAAGRGRRASRVGAGRGRAARRRDARTRCPARVPMACKAASAATASCWAWRAKSRPA